MPSNELIDIDTIRKVTNSYYGQQRCCVIIDIAFYMEYEKYFNNMYKFYIANYTKQ
ncbi:hypothetical protein DSECCO2_643150 [anaerobic digester metagenome]